MKQFIISITALVCLIFSVASLYYVFVDDVWKAFKFIVVSLNLLFIAAILNGINGKNSNKESTVSEQGMRIE